MHELIKSCRLQVRHHQDSHANGWWSDDCLKFGSENLDDAASAIDDYTQKMEKVETRLRFLSIDIRKLFNVRWISISSI
ncbi:hypothetical protein F0562_031935 [Nyssa sinensis]|uniref:Uncharacterized protein n=1 Tax=Nyssa sinensis TaxID=561372 RepID=A0A5J5AVS6_9ASTE|nr:hypothetical protein F0562_031935 [Nyssa sinensis]